MAQQISLKELGTVVLSSCGVRAVLHVPGAATSTQDLVWVATDDQLLFWTIQPFFLGQGPGSAQRRRHSIIK